MLGELPHIKGRIELVLQDAKKPDIYQFIATIKALLSEHRDDLFGKIASTISSKYKEYIDGMTNSSKQSGSLAKAAASGVKEIHEEISKLLPRERVSLIFQEAFNEAAASLETFVLGPANTFVKIKIEQ